MGIIQKLKEVNSKEKSLDIDKWYSRKVIRPISLFLTPPFKYIHPNILCFVMILIGLVSAIFFYLGGFWNLIIGIIIFQIHYIFDHVDGNVARLMDKKSIRGKYLDLVGNILVYPLILISLGFGFYNTLGNFNYVFLGLSAGFFCLANDTARLFRYQLLYDLNIKSKSKKNEKINENSNKRLLLFLISLIYSMVFSFPGVINILFFFTLFKIPYLLLIFYGVTFPILFLLRASYEFYYWKKIDSTKSK